MYVMIQVYNSAITLRATLENIIGHVEKVIMCDGPWEDFPHHNIHSTDDTHAIATDVCEDKLVWIPCRAPWKGNTVGKCNAMMSKVPMNKWFMNQGSDNTLDGDISKEFLAIEEQNRYIQANIPIIQLRKDFKVPPHRVTKSVYFNTPTTRIVTGRQANRVFKKLPGMVWGPQRDTLYMDNVPMIKKYPSYILNNLTLTNHKYMQTWEQYMCGVIYRRKLINEDLTKYYTLLEREGFFDKKN